MRKCIALKRNQTPIPCRSSPRHRRGLGSPLTRRLSQDAAWLEITREDITQLIEFQGRKRLANTRSVVEDAADELGDKEVSNHEPDHDWTARFFNDIQDVSSEEMQSLWAKVLAGEVEKPGSTSIQTLSILKNLDQATARLFGKLCSICISLRLDGNQFIDARVPSLGGNAGSNALQEYGLDFGNLNVLNEHGLVISDYNSWVDYRVVRRRLFVRTEPGQGGYSFRFSGSKLGFSDHQTSYRPRA